MGRLYYPVAVYPELKDMSFIHFVKVYLSIIIFDELDRLCWKHDMFFKNYERKEYIFVIYVRFTILIRRQYRNLRSYCCFMTSAYIYLVGVLCHIFLFETC